jgi:hypothetical protein
MINNLLYLIVGNNFNSQMLLQLVLSYIKKIFIIIIINND